MNSGSSGGKQAKTLGAIVKIGKSTKIAAIAIRIIKLVRVSKLL